MRLVIVTNSSSGLYNFRRDLIIKLKEHNIDVIVITPLDGREDQLKDLKIKVLALDLERRGMNPIRDCSYIMDLKKCLINISPDYVLTYTIKPNIYAGLVCKFKRIPYSSNITGLGSAFNNSGFLMKFVKALYANALKKACCVFFENSENLKYFVANNIIKEKQAVLLNGAGVNLDYFSYKPYPHNKVFRFLFIGRIMKDKGIEELLTAMLRLIKEKKDCILEILGGYDENYKDVIQQYERDGWLYYRGYQLDVRPYIEMANCFVLPSYHEGMANSNLESAASGRPIITSRIPGCQEAVIDGVTGLLCNSKDADSLYEAMNKMLHLSDKEREKMGIEGRRHMENCFDKYDVINKTIESLGVI